MICDLANAKPDWKAYGLGELNASERKQAEAHASDCGPCQQECSELQGTLAALATVRDEEVPRRIAFVSDKVFAPRWWQAFLRPGFAAAALLAGAIIVHGFARPVGSTELTAAAQAKLTAEITSQVTQRVQSEITATMQSTLDSAVKKAVMETKQADDRRTVALLAAAENRYQETAAFLNKQVTRIYAMNSGAGVR